MNKNVKMLVLGYITIAQFTMLSASVTANANELQDANVTEVIENIENIDNIDNTEEYIDEDTIGEDEVDKNQEDEVHKNQEDEVDKNQIVNIPDEKLREGLLRELGLKEEDNITISQLETITKLSLDGSNNIKIVDLTGLEYCKNLIDFSCVGLEISDLTPLKNLTNLEIVTLYNNKISDISKLKDLVNLKSLYINDNKINDISVLRNLVNLEHLNLINAGISDISPIENLINLKSLNLGENEISDISPLRDLVNLEQLYLYDNKIIDISPIANSTKLIVFWAWNNKINDISALENLIKEYDESIDDPLVNSQDHHDIARDMEEWIPKIRAHLEYMSDIITTVKGQAVASLSENDTEEFTVMELIKRVNILMKHELKNAYIYLNVLMKIDENQIIHGNVNVLVQVVNNMISNAIQAYDGKHDQNIQLEISKDSGNVIFSVTDFAGGLPKEVQNRLFKEMVTTKGKNGTGLGLYMSYSNIKAHFGGDITYKTEDGKGTTFNVIIPINRQ